MRLDTITLNHMLQIFCCLRHVANALLSLSPSVGFILIRLSAVEEIFWYVIQIYKIPFDVYVPSTKTRPRKDAINFGWKTIHSNNKMALILSSIVNYRVNMLIRSCCLAVFMSQMAYNRDQIKLKVIFQWKKKDYVQKIEKTFV